MGTKKQNGDKKMLTLQKLKDMNPGQFNTGTGTYPEIIDEEIRWVAVRGEYHDWTIYYLPQSEMMYCLQPKNAIEQIKTNGDKIFTESIIKRLVPCDVEAFGMYRL